MNPEEGIRLYVGADASHVQRRRCHLTGYRCFSGAYGPVSRFPPELVPEVAGLMDSGAFSEPPDARLDPEGSLDRHLRWEANATRLWGAPWRAEALVSYDLLIDEKWTGRERRKERWSVAEADRAVRVTVEAAAWLSSHRPQLAPRRLVLACQGVDGSQYEDCVRGVLAHALPCDWIGLGGWCILGTHRTWIPTFWDTCHRVLPLVASAGVMHVHIFGVMFRPVLGGLLWLCDQNGLTLSTDSSGPILQPTWKNIRRAGTLADTWEQNVILWREALRTLRQSHHYREPRRQLVLF